MTYCVCRFKQLKNLATRRSISSSAGLWPSMGKHTVRPMKLANRIATLMRSDQVFCSTLVRFPAPSCAPLQMMPAARALLDSAVTGACGQVRTMHSIKSLSKVSTFVRIFATDGGGEKL